MAEFKNAQTYILQNEGGYYLDPSPDGGETYCGISRHNFPNWSGWAIIDTLKPLSHGEVVDNLDLSNAVSAFYYKQFWQGLMGDQIQSQSVAVYCYDFYVNAMHNAVKCIQRVLGVTADGMFGNGTLNALNAAGDILQAIHAARVEYYHSIAKNGSAKFLQGWLNRANGLYGKLTA